MVGSLAPPGRHGARGGAEGSTSFAGSSRRLCYSGQNLSICDLKAGLQWHTSSNQATPPNKATPYGTTTLGYRCALLCLVLCSGAGYPTQGFVYALSQLAPLVRAFIISTQLVVLCFSVLGIELKALHRLGKYSTNKPYSLLYISRVFLLFQWWHRWSTWHHRLFVKSRIFELREIAVLPTSAPVFHRREKQVLVFESSRTFVEVSFLQPDSFS